MSLVAMCCYDTEENGRSWMTASTLESLCKTVDWNKHRLIVVNNNSCEKTVDVLYEYSEHALGAKEWMSVIHLDENVGTARAINKAWENRTSGEHCVKIDNDVVIHDSGWLDKLEQCVAAEPKIGIIGLKRRDLAEWPIRQEGITPQEFLSASTGYKSQLVALPHKYRDLSSPWLIVEKVEHCIGTCQLYSSALLDKIGFLYQLGGVYAFDDSLAAVRAKVAGFWSCFYPHYQIDHIDPGGTGDTEHKQKYAGERMELYRRVKADYLSGKRPVWQGVNDE